jgi:hypothetical protein
VESSYGMVSQGFEELCSGRRTCHAVGGGTIFNSSCAICPDPKATVRATFVRSLVRLCLISTGPESRSGAYSGKRLVDLHF